MPIAWKGTLAQYAGRLHRLHDAKREVIIYDYVDMSLPVLARMAAKRRVGYQSIGYRILGCATCWKGAFARQQTGCASRDSSSMPPPGHIFGQNGLMVVSATSSICRIR